MTNFQRLIKNPSASPGIAFFSASQVEKLAVMEFQLIHSPLVHENFESWLNELEIRINSQLIPKLQKTIYFIEQYDNEFKIKISDTTNLLPEILDYMNKNPETIDYTKPMYG